MFDDINQFTTRGMRYEIERLDTSWRIMDMETGERVYFAPYYEEWQRSAEQLLAILVVLNRRLENVESGLRRLERLISG
jgi:hypothetical protein